MRSIDSIQYLVSLKIVHQLTQRLSLSSSHTAESSDFERDQICNDIDKQNILFALCQYLLVLSYLCKDSFFLPLPAPGQSPGRCRGFGPSREASSTVREWSSSLCSWNTQ